MILSLVIRPLIPHPFRDAPFLLLIKTRPAFERSVRFYRTLHKNLIPVSPPSCLTFCGHHPSPSIAILLWLLADAPSEGRGRRGGGGSCMNSIGCYQPLLHEPVIGTLLVHFTTTTTTTVALKPDPLRPVNGGIFRVRPLMHAVKTSNARHINSVTVAHTTRQNVGGKVRTVRLDHYRVEYNF